MYASLGEQEMTAPSFVHARHSILVCSVRLRVRQVRFRRWELAAPIRIQVKVFVFVTAVTRVQIVRLNVPTRATRRTASVYRRTSTPLESGRS